MTQDAQPGQTVYVTKYALTDGILECSGAAPDANGYCSIRLPKAAYSMTVSRSQWAPTREAAGKQAAAMRDRKIKSVEKQLARLRALTF